MMMKNVSERIDALSVVIESSFEIAYDSLHQYGRKELFRKFLESMELPIRKILTTQQIDRLNQSLKENKLKLPIALPALDPYFTLHDLELVGLYYDAMLLGKKNIF